MELLTGLGHSPMSVSYVPIILCQLSAGNFITKLVHVVNRKESNAFRSAILVRAHQRARITKA